MGQGGGGGCSVDGRQEAHRQTIPGNARGDRFRTLRHVATGRERARTPRADEQNAQDRSSPGPAPEVVRQARDCHVDPTGFTSSLRPVNLMNRRNRLARLSMPAPLTGAEELTRRGAKELTRRRGEGKRECQIRQRKRHDRSQTAESRPRFGPQRFLSSPSMSPAAGVLSSLFFVFLSASPRELFLEPLVSA